MFLLGDFDFGERKPDNGIFVHYKTLWVLLFMIGFDRLCKLCGTNHNVQEIECEFHFLLQCPFYDSLRENLSAIVFDKILFNFKSIM